MKLTKSGRRSLRAGSKISVQVTTVDPAGKTVQLAKVKVGGKKAKNKKHKR